MVSDDLSSLIAFNPLSSFIPGQDPAFATQHKNRIVLDRCDQFAKEIGTLLKANFFVDLYLIRTNLPSWFPSAVSLRASK